MSDVPPPPADVPAVPAPLHLSPHAVPWHHALSWYEGAMRLFKRAPAIWATLGVLTLACELAVSEIPDVGPLLAKVIVPLVACGLLFAAAAADRGQRPKLAHAIAAFRAPGGAIVAIIASSLITFAAEALTAWWIADVNLLSSKSPSHDLSWAAIAGIYAIGILASLPITFVPFHVLFERVPALVAFTASWNAFMLNTAPLLVYAAASLVLLGLGLLTMGIGLILALPLWAASSYVAWKDVFGIREAPGESPS